MRIDFLSKISIFMIICLSFVIYYILRGLRKWSSKYPEKSTGTLITHFVFQKLSLFTILLLLNFACFTQTASYALIFSDLLDQITELHKSNIFLDQINKYIFGYSVKLHHYYLILFISLGIFIWLCSVMADFLRAYLLSLIARDIRLYFMKNLLKNNYQYFQTNNDAIGNITLIISSVVDIIDIFCRDILTCTIYSLIAICYFMYINSTFAGLFFIWCILHFILFFMRLHGYALASLYNARCYINLISKINDILNNIILIKTNNSEDFETNYIQKYNTLDTDSWSSVMRYEAVSLGIADALYYIFFHGIFMWFLLNCWNLGVISIKDMASIQSISRNLGWKIWDASHKFSSLVLKIQKVNEALSAINQRSQHTDYIKSAIDLSAQGLNSQFMIEFKNVSFGYSFYNSLLFENFNLQIKRNARIGIVGPSGSGKSTIIHLIMKFYSIRKGDILINGININLLNVSQINHYIAYISYKELIFERSIAENIGYGCEEIRNEMLELIKTKGSVAFNDLSTLSQNRIILAAKKAKAHNFISKIQKGYDAVIRIDRNLSGGEKQRISLARALIKNAKILILDEATSALDNQNEQEIVQTLHSIKDVTILIIAHKLLLVENCDIIFVMHNNRLAEAGNHKDLLLQKGLYYNLHNAQK